MDFYYQSVESNPNIPIPLGGELMAEIADMNLKFKFSLVGMEKGNFLVAKAFENDLGRSFRGDSIRDKDIKLSFVHGNTVYGFTSEVINVVTQPEKMFFMKYPKRIDELNIRVSSRYGCTLQAMTMIGHEIASMTIVDVSVDGCQAIIDTHKGSRLFDIVQIDKLFDIQVQFPATGKRGSVLGIVRNVSKDVDRIIVGLSFKDLRGDLRQEIEGFIKSLSSLKKH
ncbi:MAG: hypothetical protein A2X99_06665 [Deltaproteobacteria bacterium GWB2_55_19]|nr:MAG: hypothetical protein A2X99_06665 [Deltaproteobacteria bacterium GWB2_55_19]